MKIIKGEFDPIPAIYSEDLRALIGSMLSVNPENRPSILEILSIFLIKQFQIYR
jgi:serine/threonine protein kinase